MHTDFSSKASVYDRRHGAIISDQLAQRMGDCLVPGTTVVDIGAGTGRVAIALGRNGSRVVAIDPAISMLQSLRRKSGELSIPTVVAEGCRLPLQERSAGGVVLARVLYLVSDWRGLLSGAKEILRNGGVLFHKWGNGGLGEAWVDVREKARSLFEEAGVPTPFHPGARSEHEVESYLLEIGFRRRTRIDAGAGP